MSASNVKPNVANLHAKGHTCSCLSDISFILISLSSTAHSSQIRQGVVSNLKFNVVTLLGLVSNLKSDVASKVKVGKSYEAWVVVSWGPPLGQDENCQRPGSASLKHVFNTVHCMDIK